MENQSAINPSENVPVNSTPVSQPTIQPQTKVNLIAPILLTMLISAVVFGFGGYLLGKLTNKTNSFPITSPQNAETNKAIVSPASTIPSMSPTATTPSCKDVTGLNG